VAVGGRGVSLLPVRVGAAGAHPWTSGGSCRLATRISRTISRRVNPCGAAPGDRASGRATGPFAPPAEACALHSREGRETFLLPALYPGML
jgi:hypothetical protein